MYRIRQSSLYEIHELGLDTKNRIIYLPAVKGSSGTPEASDISYESYDSLIKNLNILNSISNKPIKLFVNSNGGDVLHGMGMYDAIKLSNSPVDAYCYGNVHSAASILIQAARHRYISPNTSMLVHYGESYVAGTHRAAKNTFAYYDKLIDNMLNIYAEKCQHGVHFDGMTFKQVKDMIGKEMTNKTDWWLNANDTIKFGLADYILTKKVYKPRKPRNQVNEA